VTSIVKWDYIELEMNHFISTAEIRKKLYVSTDVKISISKNIPDKFKEIMVGVLLGDGNLRMNGNHALLSIQQTDK
jgi:hypothetical protein